MALSPRDRRALIVLGSIVVLAAGAFFLLGNKGTKASSETIAPPPASSVSSPTPAPSPSGQSQGKHKKVLVFSGRDPFCCSPTLAVSGAPATSPGVAPAGSPSAGPSGGSSATFGGQTIVLVDIFNQDGVDQAQVEVDGTVYTVSPGDTFAGDFSLVSIDGTCATFSFQDQSFSLCETANK
jgi:hypothetical protein